MVKVKPFLTVQITGLVQTSNRLIFASEERDIYITQINVCEIQTHVCIIRSGDIDEDGSLVDFIDDGRWWVVLFDKLEGFSWRVWDREIEQEVYVGDFIVNNIIIFPIRV
ncbi:hypothetical protein KSP39_PZI014234 [Platanthera zijinensis]|uniref:Uncharacterized protein n=1 Tax=Platanthera zijinensis TaxID=2320716 RepID=A0AAP0G2T7_9ASPA